MLWPLIAAAHAGRWIDGTILSPFQIGTTAKEIMEEELGVYGVLAYLIYKVSRLLVGAWPLLEPTWLVGRLARAVGLSVTLVVSTWLLTCAYIGMLIPILALNVSWSGLILSPVVAWVVLGYVLLGEQVRVRRAELEAEIGEED
jgi:hypothetical protein